METLSLNHLLKSLCTHSQWIYAVFWKINYQTPPILAWEDGYCNYSKLEKHVGNIEYRMIREADQHATSYYGTNTYDGDSGSCSVEPAVADMFCLQYALGEGTVGSAASSGNHSWVFLEDIFARNLSSASIYEGPTEWIIQYASGIKTILLVPLLPFGVLQLGSLQMVTENLSVVAYIKDRFNDINFVDGDACASVVPRPFESLDEQTNFTTYMLEAENHGAIHDIKPPVSTFNQCVTIQDVLTVSRRIRPETLHCEKGHKSDIHRTNMEELFAPLYQSVSTGEVEFSDFISLESLLPLGSQLRNHETGLFESNPHIFHSYSLDNVVGQQSGHNLATKKEYGIADNFFSFPDDCELQKALGPVLLAQKHTNEFSYDPSSTVKDNTSSMLCSRDLKEGDIEHLLEAMISAEDISDDTFSNNTINARIADLVAKPCLSTNTYQSESSTIVVNDPALWNIPESTTTATGRKNLTSLSTSNSLVVNEREERDRDMAQHRKGMKRSNSSRQIKVTSNTRQRPRDRQLIQDRIKELRQIVPNGGKCSIDGLLEKTIKHMLYLQRVTDRAEKLKQLAQQEDFDSAKPKASLPSKVRSDNPYLRLLIKLYKFLHSRVPSGFNKVVLKRLHHSRSNKIPISLQSLVKRLKNRTDKVAVIVGTVTDDLRVLELPAIKVCALNFTEAARARIIKAGGQIYTFDQLAIQRPKGTNTILFRGPRSRREVVKRRGIPGRKNSHVKPKVRSVGRKYEKARGRRASRGFKV